MSKSNAHIMPLWNQENGPILTHIFVAFASVAIWSSVPLTIRLLTTLKQRRGLYFYSILICTWGLSIRQIGYLFQYLVRGVPWYICNILSQCGWICMVSGFAVVLYSRLNVIVDSRKIRRTVLGMIIFNGIVFHAAMTVFSIGATAIVKTGTPSQKMGLKNWKKVMNPFERIQIVVFALQETTIGFFYMHAAWRYFKARCTKEKKTRESMFLLFLVQVIIVLVDVALIVMDFMGMLQMKGFILSFSYCVKLELEFVVLNQLLEMSQMGVAGIQSFSFGKVMDDGERGAGHADAGMAETRKSEMQIGLTRHETPEGRETGEGHEVPRQGSGDEDSLGFITVAR
ncbi:hypothetical protein BCR34DRAFT_569965 [Clohesyomyces aquaticus]|uniref:DUF7703 domain-containing protein n=1 Tax=Clohesyomyces aquaticus TaxID=1231657 RepID=A0A1Y1ZDP6_9PLEO|nr:hypothetical protein BCR34DRAFT_569965 [Clohesyomyces aquaticus]